MIITEKIDIKIRKDNFQHFINLGYNNIQLQDIITIPVQHLQHDSNKKVSVKCDICGDEYILNYNKYNKNFERYNFYSCKKCSGIKRKMTNNELYNTDYPISLNEFKEKRENNNMIKYGVKNTLEIPEIRINIKNTNIERYGCENPQQNIDIKTRTELTNIEKYGFNTPLKNDDIKNKIKETNFRIYGAENIFKSEIIQNKIKSNNMLKYGVEYSTQRTDVKNKIKIGKINYSIGDTQDMIYNYDKNLYNIKCKNCDQYFEISGEILSNRKAINTTLCTICHTIGSYSSSGLEVQLYNFIKENYSGEIVTNSRKIISPLELDIYLPESKIAFEFNGIFWHNEIGKEKDYHLNKTENCEKQGIQLIHIYEDDWNNKQDIIKSIILNKLHKHTSIIDSEKCETKVIEDTNIIKDFLNNNHIQGFIASKVKLGLYYNNELVSLIIFSKNNSNYELLRFCNKLNTSVIGGASKLFKYFIENYKPNEITTYADRGISQGKLYETLGFTYINKTQPNYFYIIDGIKHNRFNFRKDKLVKQGYDENKSEHEIMLERKIFRIYDSGNLKYKYKI